MRATVLVARLREKHGCHAALVYGSRARGDATLASDWDVAGFSDAPGERWDAAVLDGGLLDAFVYGPDKVAALEPGMLRFRGARVLFDDRGVLPSLFARLDALYARGPEALGADERPGMALWYAKTLRRIALDDDEGRVRRARLVGDSLENWFRLRGRWFEGSKAAAVMLAKEAPGDHARWRRALAPDATLADLEALAKAVMGDDFIPPSALEG